jgi:SAM-dependent methyltransferase
MSVQFVTPIKIIESQIPEIAVASSRNEAYGELRYTPFHWRARRPSGTMRVMIAASLAHDWKEFWEILRGKGGRRYTVLDPMAGNGTTAREAARMGLVGIAGDINRVACINMAASYQAIDLQDIEEIKGALPPEVFDLYSTRCEICHQDSPITMRIWGAILACPNGHEFIGAPEMWGHHPLRARSPYGHMHMSRTETCPVCGSRSRFSLEDRGYVPILFRYRCPVHGRAEKIPDEEDVRKLSLAAELDEGCPGIDWAIPSDWREFTTRGFKTARDLLPPGMVFFLHHAIAACQGKEYQTKALLYLAETIRSCCRISTMTGNTFTPYSGRAVFHPHAVDLSPTSGMGRTWFSLLRRSAGARFSVINLNAAGFIPIASQSVDAVVTDPPYYDYISYSSSAYFANLIMGIQQEPINEVGGQRFAESMTSVFRECFRVLKPHGVISFTFRHPAPKAWQELGQAILQAGGVVCAVHSAQNDLDMMLSRKIAARDAIIVCARREERALRQVSLDDMPEFDIVDVQGMVPASVTAIFVNSLLDLARLPQAIEERIKRVGLKEREIYYQPTLFEHDRH